VTASPELLRFRDWFGAVDICRNRCIAFSRERKDSRVTERESRITEWFGFEETFKDQKGKSYLCLRGW